eukprot:6482018-Amphidinium_carterae.3
MSSHRSTGHSLALVYAINVAGATGLPCCLHHLLVRLLDAAVGTVLFPTVAHCPHQFFLPHRGPGVRTQLHHAQITLVSLSTFTSSTTRSTNPLSTENDIVIELTVCDEFGATVYLQELGPGFLEREYFS